MEDYLIKMRPKVVLFLVGANDIGLGAYSDWDIDFHGYQGLAYQAPLKLSRR